MKLPIISIILFFILSQIIHGMSAQEAERRDFELLEQIIPDDDQDKVQKFFMSDQQRIKPVAAFDWACQLGSKKILSTLVTADYFKEYRNRFLVRAVQLNYFEAGKLLLDNGADANFKCPGVEDSVLLLSLIRSNLPFAQLLIEHGANVNESNAAYSRTFDNYAISILGLFIQFSSYDKVEWLLQKGANPNMPSMGKGFPLSTVKDLRMCKLLCDFGANPDIVDEDRNSALMRDYEKFDMYVTLILAGANINASNKCGLTALHMAAAYNNHDLIQYLLALGADKRRRSEGKKLPVDYAYEQLGKDLQKGTVDERNIDLLMSEQMPAIPEVARKAEHKLGIAKTKLL